MVRRLFDGEIKGYHILVIVDYPVLHVTIDNINSVLDIVIINNRTDRIMIKHSGIEITVVYNSIHLFCKMLCDLYDDYRRAHHTYGPYTNCCTTNNRFLGGPCDWVAEQLNDNITDDMLFEINKLLKYSRLSGATPGDNEGSIIQDNIAVTTHNGNYLLEDKDTGMWLEIKFLDGRTNVARSLINCYKSECPVSRKRTAVM